MTNMGMLSSTSAKVPCFISPARTPSLWISATSLICVQEKIETSEDRREGFLDMQRSALRVRPGCEFAPPPDAQSSRGLRVHSCVCDTMKWCHSYKHVLAI